MALDYRTAKILFKNHQWMIQDYDGNLFLSEVIDADWPELDREDENYQKMADERLVHAMEDGYWMTKADLEHVESSGHTFVAQVCQKTWANVDAFEEGVRFMLKHCNLKPEYDVDEAFRRARHERSLYE